MTLPFDSHDDLPRSIYRVERDVRGCVSPPRAAPVRSTLRATLYFRSRISAFLFQFLKFVYSLLRSLLLIALNFLIIRFLLPSYDFSIKENICYTWQPLKTVECFIQLKYEALLMHLCTVE